MCLLNNLYKSFYSGGQEERTKGERITKGLLVQGSFQCIHAHQLYSLVCMCSRNEHAT